MEPLLARGDATGWIPQLRNCDTDPRTLCGQRPMRRPDCPNTGSSPAMAKGKQAVPEPAQRRPGRRRVPPSRPSAKAMQAGCRSPQAEEQAAKTPPRSTTLRAGLASAFGLPCDKLTALSRAEGRLTQSVRESTCRMGGPMRHDRVPFLTGLAEPERAERRRRRRRPRRLPSRTPCSRARAFPPQSAQGGQDAACRRPQPHGAAASRDSEDVGHPPVIAGRGRVRGNRAAHSPDGRRRQGAMGRESQGRWMDASRVAASVVAAARVGH